MKAVARAGCRAILAIAGIVTLVPLLSAQDTVRINGQIKKTTGVVTSLEAGDVACYISLRDDRGKEFQELAEFEICEMDGLVGKRVVLTYRVGRVIADECGGDPECTETRTVALVRSAKVAPRVVAPATPSLPAAPSGTHPGSFCTAKEEIVFSCQTGAKLVSVCVSKGASRGQGSMQYRFGKPGSREGLDQALPATAMIPRIAATGENVPFSGGGGSWLRFRNGIYSYVVYSGIGRWGPNGETREKQGVVVERSGKMVSNLPCTGRLVSVLGPDWFESLGLETRGDDFLFP
jgi:hypothetical protein